ncbi:L,D-transpeptidase family protein [Rubrivirga sp. S365]|uniref:L,D-transpeptidase family protein n=1 Tax=Rubrivirga litoralis TaxID=3075598 RepID=A0ABU3BP57_9BACT|nr:MULTISPECIES: L,D-transpeptidase family protein [unclassified Rubrivirga]MDT0631082.1 L,D-transpeptidase family protein [Rubrivirga sp. F394]MDT7855405.1 L,D-transpeptidase family protein [Rubrivirga sp. S365]
MPQTLLASPSARTAKRLPALALLLALTVAGCQSGGADVDPAAPPTTDERGGADAAVTTTGDDTVPTDLETSRYVGRGRAQAGVDTTGQADAARSNPETLDDVASADWSGPLYLPLGGDVEGPSVVKLQVLLDRAGFSPGQIDGRWGDNTELAVAWLQKVEGLKTTGIVDAATVEALARRAGSPSELATTRQLTADDVEGPFKTIPSDVYERAEMDRLGYESLGEKLGEEFHVAPELLARLNDGADLDGLSAGDELLVPNVLDEPRSSGDVASLEIFGESGYIHALDADGNVLFHAPVVVGSSYDPSPEGEFTVTSVTRDPWWHYQPSILAGVPDDLPDARLPPGPNNAVGVVWMALSKEHYGIHGTKAPETIGYASSAGCVRLTNWDASHLAGRVSDGTPVRFRDESAQGDVPSV